MLKRWIAAGITSLLAVAAFFIFFKQDAPSAPEEVGDASQNRVESFIVRPTTQPERYIEGGELKLTPGERPYARIYDRVTGEAKYEFRADKWEPINDTEFQLSRPEIRIHMPDGQTTYIRSDEGQVVMSQSGRRQVDPKRGWLRGDVRVQIDRTTKAWRAAHPEAAESDQHQDQVINIFLSEVRFDLDRSRLESDGPLRVQSVEADVDATGLLLTWNQVDNRIESLVLAHGKRMELRRGGGMVEFSLPGTERTSGANKPSRRGAGKPGKQRPADSAVVAGDDAAAKKGDTSAAKAAAEIRSATGVKPPDPADLAALTKAMADEARRATMRNAEAGAAPVSTAPTEQTADAAKRPHVDTYSAVFSGDVVVEQRSGLRRPGRLVCDRLELVFDFGKKQKRQGLGRSPASQPADADGAAAGAESKGAPKPAAADVADPTATEDTTQLVLTWTGPLELRPLTMSPAEQSGERFDAIASGRVEVSDGRGAASCRQLVYRNERQQAWLSAGDGPDPVVILSGGEEQPDPEGPPRKSPPGRLSGREVFFDRSRGLARIEGEGSMVREAAQRGDAAGATAFVAKAGDGDIRWMRGVEIELKQARERQVDPATGEARTIVRDYLARAWFHGGVQIQRGNELIAGEDVEVSFGVPQKRGGTTGPIEHLYALGKVRLERRPDMIRAEKLDVRFTTTPEGDSVPTEAIAEGRVLAMQDTRRIRARSIEVKMTSIPADTAAGATRGAAPGSTAAAPSTARPNPMGVGSARSNTLTEVPSDRPAPARRRMQLALTELTARGRVSAVDRNQGLAIKAEFLHALIPDGRNMTLATVMGPAPDEFARVSYETYDLSGYRIDADIREQAADINGPGRVEFHSDRDFGGGELRRGERTRVTWSNYMQARGRQNRIYFDGNVRARSDSHEMKGARMTVFLADAPPPRPAPPKQPTSPAERFRRKPNPLLGYRETLALAAYDAGLKLFDDTRKQLNTLTGSTGKPAAPKRDAVASPISGNIRKQPIRISVTGSPVAERAVRTPVTQRLQTRMQITGEAIDVDLRQQGLNVTGRGTLLIEDYQLGRAGHSGRGGDERVSILGGGSSPSQTVFRWANGMSYFVDQALVKFDRQVFMRHVSGQNIIRKAELAAANNIDPRALRLPPGRSSELTCDDLMVQFLRRPDQPAESMSTRGADVRQLAANGSVSLQDGTRSLMCDRLTYARETNRVTLESTPQYPARIFDQDEETQRLYKWEGPLLVWDRSTNRIEAPNARVTSSSR